MPNGNPPQFIERMFETLWLGIVLLAIGLLLFAAIIIAYVKGRSRKTFGELVDYIFFSAWDFLALSFVLLLLGVVITANCWLKR